mmetsp:Transcript_1319/g.3893  ORF Transcript_1319/g.3893 Transcript_1319/m.3893 type:complete len:230 (+) Transcript_1319:2033-2722(+)
MLLSARYRSSSWPCITSAATESAPSSSSPLPERSSDSSASGVSSDPQEMSLQNASTPELPRPQPCKFNFRKVGRAERQSRSRLRIALWDSRLRLKPSTVKVPAALPWPTALAKAVMARSTGAVMASSRWSSTSRPWATAWPSAAASSGPSPHSPRSSARQKSRWPSSPTQLARSAPICSELTGPDPTRSRCRSVCWPTTAGACASAVRASAEPTSAASGSAPAALHNSP